jgi:hypothetical protein
VTDLVKFSTFFQISPFEFLLQMAAPSNVSWDHAGHLHTNGLHWDGFPHLLWDSMIEWSIGRKVFLGVESR